MKRIKKIGISVFVSILALVFLLPLVATVCGSFMTQPELNHAFAAGELPHLLPRRFSLGGYKELLFSDGSYLRMFWNSLLIASVAALGNACAGLLVGYGLAKVRFPCRTVLRFLYIVVMMMPFQVTLLPNYMVLRRLGLLDTLWALMLPGIFAPLGVFLMTQFLRSMPMEEIKAARLDNATLPRFLVRIVLPRAWPGLAACLLLSFAETWNMVEQPLVLLTTRSLYPLSMAFSASGSDVCTPVMLAGAVLYMLPALFLYLIFEEELISGIGSASM